MNFWNMAALGLTFLTPAGAVLIIAVKGKRAPGLEIKACLALFGVAMALAAVGVAHFDHSIKMELLWPLTMEQSGYFEFSLQLLWSRFVWIFYSGVMLLGFTAYDGLSQLQNGRGRRSLLFLAGSFFASALAFLSENILLSLLFVEISVFMLHAFGMESGGDPDQTEKAAYFKRNCFLFLGLAALLGIAISHELNASSVMLMGVVLYILSTVVSTHNPSRWDKLPLLFAQLGMTLFLLERVLVTEVPTQLAAPLSAIFAVCTLLFSILALLSPGTLGASFWMVLSFFGYLLYLRFSSARPADPFWGAYEAIGLGAAYALTTIFRFGEHLDLLWKRALAFGIVAILLGVVSGALPSVEISAARFDNETSLAHVVILGYLTFLVAVVSAKSLAVSFGEKNSAGAFSKPSYALVACLAPAVIMLTTQVGVLVRWSDLNIESFLGGGLLELLYDPRVLATATAVGVGLFAGGLLGTNINFTKWTKSREAKMEDFFPRIDPALVARSLRLVSLPEQGVERVTAWLVIASATGASFLDSLDRGFFGEKFFHGFSEFSSSLSRLIRFFHSGQARAYLFLGALITLFSSLIFLLEGR